MSSNRSSLCHHAALSQAANFHFFTKPIETNQTNNQTQQRNKQKSKQTNATDRQTNKQAQQLWYDGATPSEHTHVPRGRPGFDWPPMQWNSFLGKYPLDLDFLVFLAIFFGIVVIYDLWEASLALWWDIIWRVWEISWAVWPLAWPGKAVLSCIGVTRRTSPLPPLTPPVMSSLIGKSFLL